MDSSAFGGVTYGRTVEYMWYRPGFHNPLLNITYDTAGGTTPYVSDVVYHTSTTPSTGITNLYSENNVSLYPNPASDVLNVRYNLAGGTATINIADITGHVIFATNENLQAGQHDIKIPVQMLGNGMYLLQMTTAEGTTTRKFTIAK
jgi:hypothetical protein